jgi:Protein of unknown function (DUF2934)
MAKRKSQSRETDAVANEVAEKSRPSSRPKRAVARGPEVGDVPAEPERAAATTEPLSSGGSQVSPTLTVPDQSPAEESDVDPSEDDIRHRAYQRYLERGGAHGADFDDWVHAEQELKKKKR